MREISGTHGEEHERLLAEWIAGELDEDGGLVRAALSHCPVCRPELERLPALAARLERVGREAHALIEAAQSGGAAEEEWMLRTYRERIAPRPRAGSSLRGRRWMLAGIAAGLIALLGWLQVVRRPEPAVQPPVMLAGEDLRLLCPVGADSDYGLFRWECEALAGRTYHLEVWSDDTRTELLDQSPARYREQQWSPEPGAAAAWPERIYWTVEVQDLGRFTTSAGASASR